VISRPGFALFAAAVDFQPDYCPPLFADEMRRRRRSQIAATVRFQDLCFPLKPGILPTRTATEDG
jgi:hypothetical protein